MNGGAMSVDRYIDFFRLKVLKRIQISASEPFVSYNPQTKTVAVKEYKKIKTINFYLTEIKSRYIHAC